MNKDLKRITIDIREPMEWGMIVPLDGSILLPMSQYDTWKYLVDRTAPINLICRSGSRTKELIKQMIDDGFQDLNDIGGIIDIK